MAKGWAALIAVIGMSVGVLAGFLTAIQMNPGTADRYVLSLGSVGEWVSGVGALAAVVVAIVLADKQRQENMERIVLKCDLQRFRNDGAGSVAKSLVVDAVSSGNRPARLTGAKILDRKGNICWTGHHAGEAGKGFPIELNYGEKTEIWIGAVDVKDVIEHFDGDFSSAKMIVTSTLASWEINISEHLKQLQFYRDNPPKSLFN